MFMVVQISLEHQLVNWCFFVTGELVYHVRRAEITVISNGSISFIFNYMLQDANYLLRCTELCIVLDITKYAE
jgi:hypothetical protein